MDYWHLQMHLPAGRDGRTEIDSSAMLREDKPVIGTGEWDDPQCRQFKGEQNGIQKGAIVMVRKGNTPIALVKVISDCFNDEDLEEKYINHNYRQVEVLDWNKSGETSDLFSQGTLKKLLESSNTASWQYINHWYQKASAMIDTETAIKVLKFKKQIILQGPPGTGKTRIARQLAKQMVMESFSGGIEEKDILNIIHSGLELGTPTAYNTFVVTEINLKGKSLKVKPKDSQHAYAVSFQQLLDNTNSRSWEQPVSNSNSSGNASYLVSLAKYLAEEKCKEYYPVVQFHPSYSYEDFVRGILAESKGESIDYKNVNKILGELAVKASANWESSKMDSDRALKEKKTWEYFNHFVEAVTEILADLGKLQLTPYVNLLDIEQDAFRYKGEAGWNAFGNRMPFKDIVQAYLDGNDSRQDIKNNDNLSGLAKQHATYFVRVLKMFKEHLIQNNLTFSQSKISKAPAKNFVLIIDEINRANLSSVLGELIYALEYREEKVESMYSIDGDRKISLPPNLFIIGTMNTADRSVGHIDYAIRRRFSFLDVMPKDLSPELGDKFHKVLFDQVASLFSTNRSPEFEIKDVQIGHSYFIENAEEGGTIKMRLEYEIKPILREYIKDGVLIGDDIQKKVEDLAV